MILQKIKIMFLTIAIMVHSIVLLMVAFKNTAIEKHYQVSLLLLAIVWPFTEIFKEEGKNKDEN